MQRNMSYRKPVPVYVPSPPPSPAPEPPLPSLQDDELMVATREEPEGEKPVPPLPENWREILAEKVCAIETATAKGDVTVSDEVGGTTHDDNALPEEEQDETLMVLPEEPVPSVNIDKDQESFTTIAASHQLNSQIQRNGRGLPTKYRPPTPPLRSHSKQVLSDIHYSHGVYLPNTSPKPYHSSVQLKPSSSFRTDRTMVSMNTTNYSMGWPNGLPTSSSTPMYSYPTLLIQKRNIEALREPNPDSSNDPSDDSGCLFKACWPKFGGWTKRFPGLQSISKRT